MKKHDDNLFQIGEVTKIMGVTRKALLVYEEMGLLTPAAKLDMMCCIPVEDDFKSPERVEFAETPALCIYYRGPYEGITAAIQTLLAYVKENSIEITGPFRSIYLEGPPNRGENSGDYITQIAVPVKQ